jgi:hypothetical protein
MRTALNGAIDVARNKKADHWLNQKAKGFSEQNASRQAALRGFLD